MPKETIDTRFDQINEIFVTYTTRCSQICRQIVFALFAVVWALSYHGGTFDFCPCAWVVMFLLVCYLATDIGQYFYTACTYRRQFYRLRRQLHSIKIRGEETEKECLDIDEDRCNRISDNGFWFFVVKMALLTLAVLALFCTLIQKINRQTEVPTVPVGKIITVHTADFVVQA